MRSLGLFLAWLSLLISSGGHWAALRVTAYLGMAVEYSSDAGIARGLAMTFDGQHPCSMCHAIERGQAHEQEKEPQERPWEPHQFIKICPKPAGKFIFPRIERRAAGILAAAETPPTRAILPELPPPEWA